MTYAPLISKLKGGAGSGNFGHSGRPGKIGGSTAASYYPGTSIPVNMATYDRVLADQLGRHDEETLAEAMHVFKNLLRDAAVCMRVPTKVMRLIAEEGEFKNQHQTYTSNGMLNPEVRAAAERNAFGEHLNKPEDFPIYGYVNTTKNGLSPEVGSYGYVKVVFNDAVKQRTTVTYEDSLGSFGERSATGTPMLNPSLPSLDREVKYVKDMYASYVEAQIHGKLTVKDIKRVLVDEDAALPNLLTSLEKAGIPYKVVSGQDIEAED